MGDGVQAGRAASDTELADWVQRARRLESAVRTAIVGQDRAVRLATVAVFARGHVLLEGDVGVGKTTLLRAIARAVGGDYERIEGTVDLMPADLLYHTYIGDEGRPRVEPGPLLRHGERLSVFFFNEVNRARPQVHSLLLRVMAERSATAFNTEYRFPHLQVFADRNRVERDETFELPAAARDRFLMEIGIEAPEDDEIQRGLTFDPRYHDTEALVESVDHAVVPFDALHGIASAIQQGIHVSTALQDYALNLRKALRRPEDFGIRLEDVEVADLVHGGASPRGMSALVRAARVHAWLAGREMVVPEDLHAVFHEVMCHRIFLNPVYEYRREAVVQALARGVLDAVAAP